MCGLVNQVDLWLWKYEEEKRRRYIGILFVKKMIKGMLKVLC